MHKQISLHSIYTFFLLSACLAALFAGCGEQQARRESTVSVDTEVDFVLRMREERFTTSNPNFGYLNIVEINGLRHWGIYEHAPCRLEFPDVYIGTAPRLEFSIGILPGAWEKPGDGVRFEISAVASDESSQILYSEYIDPRKHADQRRWLPRSVALDAIAGATATIVFETFPSDEKTSADNHSDWAFWADPRLRSQGRQEKHIPHEKPNILLITLDTLRTDYVGCYGNDWIQTPALDRLAGSGVLFEKAYTVSYHTNPSHLSMLTSLSPYAHGIIGNQQVLTTPLPCLPQILQELGYTTLAAISACHLDNFMTGLSAWFDYYDKTLPQKVRTGSMISSLAIRRLEQIHNEPFFYWLHYYDSHQPYLALGKYNRMYYEGDPADPSHDSMKSASFPEDWNIDSPNNWMRPFKDLQYFKMEYAAEITYMDAQLERVFDALRRLQLEDNTIVIVVADHGEGLGDHHVYFDHWTQFNEDIRVPFIMAYPNLLPEGRRVHANASTLDIAPTILDLIGEQENYLANQLFEGRSLRPLWESPDERAAERVAGFTNGPYYVNNAAYDERYKVIWEMQRKVYNRDYQTLSDRVRIYDMQDDPHEQNPAAVFYWGNTDQRIDPWEEEENSPPPVISDDDIQRVKQTARRKIVPGVEILQQWLLEDNGRDFIQEKYRNDQDFFERIVILLEKVKQTVNPPTAVERVKDMPDMASLFGEDGGGVKPLNDPAMKDFLQSLGYAGN
ncbi:MAG: sulfatase [Candidatus Omnitrophica bacterium]|nr:sulfatase [Candidatus Omnitrophota bacterium]